MSTHFPGKTVMGAAPKLLLLGPVPLPMVNVALAVPKQGFWQKASNPYFTNIALLLAVFQWKWPMRCPSTAPRGGSIAMTVKATKASMRVVPLVWA